MITLNLALGFISAGVLFMLDTIARDLPMDSIALPLTATLVGALVAGRFLPSLLSRFWTDRKAATLWQGRTVLLVAAIMLGASSWDLWSGPNVMAVAPEASMRQLVRACVWGLGLVGCWLAVRQNSAGELSWHSSP